MDVEYRANMSGQHLRIIEDRISLMNAHVFDCQDIHAVNLDAWHVVAPCVELCRLGGPPFCCTHACLTRGLDLLAAEMAQRDYWKRCKESAAVVQQKHRGEKSWSIMFCFSTFSFSGSESAGHS